MKNFCEIFVIHSVYSWNNKNQNKNLWIGTIPFLTSISQIIQSEISSMPVWKGQINSILFIVMLFYFSTNFQKNRKIFARCIMSFIRTGLNAYISFENWSHYRKFENDLNEKRTTYIFGQRSDHFWWFQYPKKCTHMHAANNRKIKMVISFKTDPIRVIWNRCCVCVCVFLLSTWWKLLLTFLACLGMHTCMCVQSLTKKNILQTDSYDFKSVFIRPLPVYYYISV